MAAPTVEGFLSLLDRQPAESMAATQPGKEFVSGPQLHAKQELTLPAGAAPEEILRAIFDGTFEYIGLLAPDGTLLEANRASLEFAGSAREQVLGLRLWDLPVFARVPGAPEAARQAVTRAAAGEFVRFEVTLRRPSDEYATLDVSLHPVENERGEVVLIVPEGRDITQRKLAEERLEQQWHTFDTALSNTPDIIYTLDLEGRFTYANRQLSVVSRRPLSETLGKTSRELGYPPALVERLDRQLRQVIETKQNLRDQTTFTLPSGEVREYEYIYAPILAEDGRVTAVAGSTRDVTERKRAEEKLRESETRLRQALDCMPQLVWSALPDGQYDFFNKQWFEYTGLSPEDAGGGGWEKVLHPEDRPAATEMWRRSLATGQPFEIEYRCRRFDGEYRWFLGRAEPVFDDAHHVVRWFGTSTDIHCRKESEEALRKANRELEEFSFVVSHDLREPLRTVNIYTQLILKGVPGADANLQKYSGFVQKGIARMEMLIQDLLTYAKTTHGDHAPAAEADLSASLHEALAILKNEIETNGALVHVQNLPAVRGDTEQLAHVFQNLLSNALKYRRQGVRPEIDIGARREGDHCIVSVRDNGIGFDQRYAERIFGLFKRLHKDEYPGTGLGLAICQRIVERYGGRMWAQGKPGEGACFSFSLPAA